MLLSQSAKRAFPILFFTGVCLVLLMCQNRIGDLWMRTVGLILLSVAFAAAVHHFKSGSYDGFPEGRGGSHWHQYR